MSSALYISDLDGTLLRPDGTLSPASRDGLNRLIADGLHFTVATARSVASIRHLLAGLDLHLPVVNLNGALLSDVSSGRHQYVQTIPPEIAAVVYEQTRAMGPYPFISTCGPRGDALYYSRVENAGMQWLVDDRLDAGDERLQQIEDLRAALCEQVLAFTIIVHQPALLQTLQTTLEERCPGRLQMYIFPNGYSQSGDTWLTICHARATKDRAIRKLLTWGNYRVEDLTVFGDGDNDIGMFELAPRAIATANATKRLRNLATDVIGPNSEDGVLRYLSAQMR
jgi:Cof subfamily protein (haloacid dehalogenase superfamily)